MGESGSGVFGNCSTARRSPKRAESQPKHKNKHSCKKLHAYWGENDSVSGKPDHNMKTSNNSVRSCMFIREKVVPLGSFYINWLIKEATPT